MNTNKILAVAIDIAGIYTVYKLGKAAGYVKCMNDVVEQHSDILPDEKLSLSGKGRFRKFKVSVSKPKVEES